MTKHFIHWKPKDTIGKRALGVGAIELNREPSQWTITLNMRSHLTIEKKLNIIQRRNKANQSIEKIYESIINMLRRKGYTVQPQNKE